MDEMQECPVHGTNSRETNSTYLPSKSSRLTNCSCFSRLDISVASTWTGKDNGFVARDTQTAGRENMTTEQPLEIICLPLNAARSLSGSDVSSLSVSLNVQEGTCGTSFRMFGAPSRASFEDVPTTAYCVACGTQVLTYIKYRNSNLTWALAGLLCAFGCHLGCCLVPFCIKTFKDVIHLCPLCMAELGIYAKG